LGFVREYHTYTVYLINESDLRFSQNQKKNCYRLYRGFYILVGMYLENSLLMVSVILVHQLASVAYTAILLKNKSVGHPGKRISILPSKLYVVNFVCLPIINIMSDYHDCSLGLTTAIIADVSIALLLVLYYLSRDMTLRSSQRYALFLLIRCREVKISQPRLVRRLVSLALKTGTFTAINAVAVIIAYAADKQSNGAYTLILFDVSSDTLSQNITPVIKISRIVYLIPSYSLSPVYSLTLLYNLNVRKRLRGTEIRISDVFMPGLESHTNAQRRPVYEANSGLQSQTPECM
jgi:hypothetical protein